MVLGPLDLVGRVQLERPAGRASDAGDGGLQQIVGGGVEVDGRLVLLMLVQVDGAGRDDRREAEDDRDDDLQAGLPGAGRRARGVRGAMLRLSRSANDAPFYRLLVLRDRHEVRRRPPRPRQVGAVGAPRTVLLLKHDQMLTHRLGFFQSGLSKDIRAGLLELTMTTNLGVAFRDRDSGGPAHARPLRPPLRDREPDRRGARGRGRGARGAARAREWTSRRTPPPRRRRPGPGT